MTTTPSSPPPSSPQQPAATAPAPPPPAPQAPWPYPPYGYPPYLPPAPQPHDSRGPLGLVSWTAGKVVAVVLVLLILFGGYVVIMLLLSQDTTTPDVVSNYDQNVTIAEGGHFRYPITSNVWQDTHVLINVTSDGVARFDVYVMDANQYENAYANLTTHAFSAVERFENRTSVVGEVELPNDGGTYYLVIDNMANELTPGGAVPTGPLSVHLWVRIVQHPL